MGKTHRKSIIKQAIERFDSLMALGESRFEARQEARREASTRGTRPWTYTTGKIHSHKTRVSYQEHTLRFIHWARETEGIKTLEILDARADELASHWLVLEMAAGKSPYTLQLERAALRLFFSDRTLGSSIILPRRALKNIKRSRNAAARDRQFQPEHWQPLLDFQRAVGLRRDELARLKVEDIRVWGGELKVYVLLGKGGKARAVPVLPGSEPSVLAVVEGRPPEERVFARLPDIDLHALRREYAQALYRVYAPGWPPLPPAGARALSPEDYHQEAVRRVSEALGHRRLDVVLEHYLR